jgi:hypothetical protein
MKTITDAKDCVAWEEVQDHEAKRLMRKGTLP